MNQIDLAFTPAVEQAQLIRSKQVSPLELTELYLERIHRLDGNLGSYFTVMTDVALADAKAKTEALAGDTSELPPFFGVPISIKDLNPVAGVRCTYGTPALRDKIAAYDDAVAGRIKMAGFTILGKTATPELGSMPFTEAPGFPPTRNPVESGLYARGVEWRCIGGDSGGVVRFSSRF
jgi:amidase